MSCVPLRTVSRDGHRTPEAPELPAEQRFQPEVVLPPTGHLAMSGHMLEGRNSSEGGTGFRWTSDSA